MKKLSIPTLFLTLVGSIYLFVSLIFGVVTGADADFWTGFGFFTFGAIVAVVILLLFGNKQTTIKDVFFNAPIYYIGAVYFAVSGIISVLHMLIGLLPFKWLFVIELIVFAVFAVYFILAMVSKTNAENVTEKVKVKNDFIRTMTVKLENIASGIEDRDTRIKVESLAEEFKYSKPIAHKDLIEIESKIEIAVDELAEANDIDASVKAIKLMITQRNNIAKLIK